MPSRVIRGGINTSESLSRVSLGANLCFRALVSAVDDYGRIDARPAILRATLFPLLLDQVSTEDVAGWLDELAHSDDPERHPGAGCSGPSCVVVYEVEGYFYLHLPKWEIHRGKTKRGGRSRWPGPPDDQGSPRIPADPRGSPRKPGGSSEAHGDPRIPVRGVEETRSRRKIVPQEKIETLVEDRADAALAARPPADPTPLLNLLSKEPGTIAEKAAWLDREYPLLLEMAARDYPGDPERQRREINSRVIRHWRQYRKNPTGPGGERLSPAQAREERGRQVVAKLNEEDRRARGERSRPAERDVTPDVRRLRGGDH